MVNSFQRVMNRIEELYTKMGVAPPAATAAAKPENVDGKSFQTAMNEVKSDVPYRDLIIEAAARHQVPAKLVESVIRTESGFDAQAISPKGAQGLMQLMPQTASDLGVRNPMNPAENINGGTQYLKSMLNQFSDLKSAVAAYNAGPEAVTKYKGVPPYPETQNYVEKVLGSFLDKS